MNKLERAIADGIASARAIKNAEGSKKEIEAVQLMDKHKAAVLEYKARFEEADVLYINVKTAVGFGGEG